MKLKINPKTLDRMDYQIAIPSYRRSDQITQKTLKTLAESAVPRDKITIFIVADEEALYKNACPDYNIVIGALGLVEQRRVIQEYYPINSYVVMMDDDITELYKPLTEKTKEKITDLPSCFNEMINKMIQEEVSICGIYPCNNFKFALGNQDVTTKFSYIVGALYIIKNTRDPDVQPKSSILEDRERTVLYYIKEKKTLRFNRICLKTKYFGVGGLDAVDRISKHTAEARQLCLQFPLYLRLKTCKTRLRKKEELVDCKCKRLSKNTQ